MKKSLILFLDTAKRETIKVVLEINGVKTAHGEIIQNTRAQNTLVMIEKILKENNLQLSDLTGIRINRGPGSFIGLRVGVTVANVLGFLLQIPVNGCKPPVLPIYE